MITTAVRRAGLMAAAGVLLTAAWSGTASAAPAEQAAPASAQASGRNWCGFAYDPCIYQQELATHNGYQVSPLYWAGTDNTCIPGHQCNGYYFDWWE
jgi:hypothetical protein